MSSRITILAAGLGVLLMASVVSAATVVERTGLVGLNRSLDVQAPEPIAFTVTSAGAYTATLRDLNTPGLLKSLRAIVTRDFKIVAELELVYAGAMAPAPATDAFNATPGVYQLLVIGAADSVIGGGSFGVAVAPSAGGASVVDAANVIAANGSEPDGVSVLQSRFDVTAAGAYQLDLTDHVFPRALAKLDAIVLPATGGGVTAVLPTGAASVAFTAAAGAYHLIVIARADPADLAGLYSARVNGGPAAATVYRSTNAVGRLTPGVDLTIPAAGDYSLVRTDAKFPTALASLKVALIQSSALAGAASGEGTSVVTMQQGGAQLFSFAVPVAIGAFSVRVEQGATVAFADVVLVDASFDPSTPAIYSLTPAQPAAAGGHRLTLEDFRFPQAFASLDAAVVQAGALIDRLTAAGALNVTLAAAPVKVIIAARPPAGPPPGNALFGVKLVRADGAVVLESTQGVGGLFRKEVVEIPAAGPYDITLADLGFPAPMRTNALAVTAGVDLVTQIFGGGVTPRQTLTPRKYVLNFLGQPGKDKNNKDENYGAYGFKIADSPAPPVVSLSATPAVVTQGGRSTLQWSAQDATACTAAGGWTGGKAVSGSEQTAVLSTNATFELTCTGPGGGTKASTAVVVNPPTAGRKGGGGSMGWLALIYMSVMTVGGLRSRLIRRVRDLSFT